MQVLQHHQHRLGRGGVRNPARQALTHAELRALVLLATLLELFAELFEDLLPRPQRGGSTVLRAAADEHPPSPDGGMTGELRGET